MLGRQAIADKDGRIASFSASSRELNIEFEGLNRIDLASSGSAIQRVAAKLRSDTKGRKDLLGAELQLGGTFEGWHGLSVSGTGRVLKYREVSSPLWGLNGSMNYASGGMGIGINLNLSVSIGRNHSLSDNLNEVSKLNFGIDRYADGWELGSEIGYGMEFQDSAAVVKPYYGLDTESSGIAAHRPGTGMGFGSGLIFDLSGKREIHTDGFVGHRINLDSRISW